MKEFFSNNEYFSANILLNGEILLPFTFYIVEHILGLSISTWNKARKQKTHRLERSGYLYSFVDLIMYIKIFQKNL